MKVFSIFTILFIFFSKVGMAQYERAEGFIYAEGQQLLTLERQVELLNEMQKADQWKVFLSLSMGCYVVSDMVLQMDGFSEDYWEQIKFNSMQGVIEVFKDVGVKERSVEDAFTHFANLQEGIYKKAKTSDGFSEFFVDEMGFCSKFFGLAWEH